MKLSLNFQSGGVGLRKNPFRGGGMDIFWNYTKQLKGAERKLQAGENYRKFNSIQKWTCSLSSLYEISFGFSIQGKVFKHYHLLFLSE